MFVRQTSWTRLVRGKVAKQVNKLQHTYANFGYREIFFTFVSENIRCYILSLTRGYKVHKRGFVAGINKLVASVTQHRPK